MFQLIYKDKVIKEFPTRYQCVAEAFSRSLVITGADDFFDEGFDKCFIDGVTIKEVKC